MLDFLEYLENTRSCSARSRNARFVAIRNLFGFIAREQPCLVLNCQSIRTIPLKHIQHKTVGYLKENQMQALLNSVDLNARAGIRYDALLLLLYNTGAWVSEIVQRQKRREDLKMGIYLQVLF